MEKTPWYNDSTLLGVLVFIIPPVGLYGVVKNTSLKKSYKWIYASFGILEVVTIIRIVLI